MSTKLSDIETSPSPGQEREDDSIPAFKENSKHSNIVLIVENKKIPTNKWFLSVASPVFKTMFTSDFKEKEAEEVRLEGKQYDTFTTFLQCLMPGGPVKLTGKQDDFLKYIFKHRQQKHFRSNY